MTESPGNNSPPPPSYGSPPIPVILTVIFILVFLVGFFSFCFCRCFIDNVIHNWNNHSPSNSPTAAVVQNGQNNHQSGLEPSIIQSFPTFKYSSVKDLRSEKFGLECAICLLEFEDYSVLRLITACCHVFHQECVDLWLEFHNTCPVCRRNLSKTSPNRLTPANATPENRGISDETGSPNEDTFSIDINGRDQEAGDVCKCMTTKFEAVERFSRSHSTGHSIPKSRTMDGKEKKKGKVEESGVKTGDRYILRLPEHLHAKLLRGHHLSCTEFGDHKDPVSTSGHFGEVSEFSEGNVNRV